MAAWGGGPSGECAPRGPLYRRATRALHHPTLEPADAATVLERNLIGNNVGNLAFSHASERLLTHPGDDVTAAPTGPWFADPARVNRE